MGFVMADLVLEATIREGLENIRRNPSIVEDIFSALTQSYASKKYGDAEINKIKNLLTEKEISIVHSFNLVQANVPCISIQLLDESESTQHATLGDTGFTEEIALADLANAEERLAELIKVPAFTPTSYDSKSGLILVPDGVDLSQIHVNLLFVDTNADEFPIVGGIDNTIGQKQFMVAKGSTVTIGANSVIKSSFDTDIFPLERNWEKVNLALGIHTKDPNITKYLYILVKYFLLSRKDDICNRGIRLQTHSGSDFSRNDAYKADAVFTRMITFSGFAANTWRLDKVQLIDHIDVDVISIE